MFFSTKYHKKFLNHTKKSIILDISNYIDSNFTIRNYFFDMEISILKNTWIQFVFVQNVTNLRVFIDAVPKFDLQNFKPLFNSSFCYDFLAHKNSKFKKNLKVFS